MLLLFDIDGTLIRSSGAGMRAMDDAFATQHGVAGASAAVVPDGKTDPAIIREMFVTALGREADPAEVDRMLAGYLAALTVRLDEAAALGRLVVLPGLPRVLETARGRGDTLGLATGNVKAGARLKLSRVGLLSWFGDDPCGGFACDFADRTELTRRGIERGCASAGRPFAAGEVVVIGDTPRDVAAARGAGVRCIGVATGRHSVRDLAASGAAAAIETLESFDQALASLS